MMGLIKCLTGFILIFLSSSLTAQEDDNARDVYFFHFGHLGPSIRHEAGVSVGTHFVRSPMQAEYYDVREGIAYPEPVYNRAIGILSASYEPRIRLVEFGSVSSISLDLPLVASLSTVDVRTREGIHFSPEELTESQIFSGVYHNDRDGALGFFHTEIGGLVSFNAFQGATYENTKALGISISGGVKYIVAPLMMNFFRDYNRDDYSDMTRWLTPVARIGLQLRGVGVYYTLGINPTRVNYQTPFEKRSTFINTYNRFSVAMRIGR